MNQSASNPPQPPVAPAALWPLVLGLGASALATYFVAPLIGARLTPEAPGLARGGAWAAACVGLGALAGLFFLLPPGVRTSAKLSTCVLIASAARLLFLLALSLVVFFLVKPAGESLFGGIALGGALCLFFETAWSTRYLKHAARARSGALLA